MKTAQTSTQGALFCKKEQALYRSGSPRVGIGGSITAHDQVLSPAASSQPLPVCRIHLLGSCSRVKRLFVRLVEDSDFSQLPTPAELAKKLSRAYKRLCEEGQPTVGVEVVRVRVGCDSFIYARVCLTRVRSGKPRKKQLEVFGSNEDFCRNLPAACRNLRA